MPKPNAATRSALGAGLGFGGGRSRRAIVAIFFDFERALIDLATRPPGGERHFANRILDRDACQRATQQVIEIDGARNVGGLWSNDENEFAASFGVAGIVPRQNFLPTSPPFWLSVGARPI